MLHIIFLILKIIGVILLAILGLIVLLLCVLLFAAVKYEGQASGTKTLQSVSAEFKLHWFFHLVRVHLTYRNETLFYQVKVAWKVLASSENEAGSSPEPERGTGEAVKVADEPVVTMQSIPEERIPQEMPEIEAKPEVEAKPEIEAKSEAVSMPARKAETVRETERPDKEEDHRKEKNTWKRFAERISGVFRRIKYTFEKICDNIKRLIETKEKFVEFITDEIHTSAWKRTWREVKRLLRRLNPKKLELDLHFGFDDPSVTGKLLAFFGMLYPLTTHHVQLRPDFERQILEGEGRIKGRVRIAYFVSAALHMLLDKNVRMTYKDIRNLR